MAEVSSACPPGTQVAPLGSGQHTLSPWGILQKGLDLLQEVGGVVMEELREVVQDT